MASLFLADPALLRQEGEKLVAQSIEFDSNVDKMYETVHQLTASGYVSDAARAIANEIEKRHGDLDAMTKAIRDYGDYLRQTSKSVVDNENKIIDNINIGNVD